VTRHRIAAATVLAVLLSAAAPRPLPAQERGAAALAQAVDGLGVTTRVLMIGAHPDDEDTQLLAWLARGRRVETAYLSLTRGDGGQNLIGNELGEALGAIRTEELLAARRVDGATQYFTRAYDFGFSKTAEETYRHWPKDTLLGDVVRVVRAFRPHVIVAVFSGTPRDGHGHHQVSGLLAREAYDVAGDSARFARAAYGAPWTPLKFYRSQRFQPDGATLRVNVGEYDPVLGRSFAEIAGESRSQHKSQGFGALERKGPVFTHVRREAARVGPPDAASERALFDGIDTTWTRFASVREPRLRAALDSITALVAAVQASLDVRRPGRSVPALARLYAITAALCPPRDGSVTAMGCSPLAGGAAGAPTQESADLQRTAQVGVGRALEAARLAAGVSLEAEAVREVAPDGGAPVRVVVRLHNQGDDSVRLSAPQVYDGWSDPTVTAMPSRWLATGASRTDTLTLTPRGSTQPWWLRRPRSGDWFVDPPTTDEANRQGAAASVAAAFAVAGATDVTLGVAAPIVYRYADAVRGDVSRPLAVAPAVSVTLDRPLEVVAANTALRRPVAVHLRSADTAQRQVVVRLHLPRGMSADSAARTVTLAGYDAEATVSFTVTGWMAPGRDTIGVVAESGGQTFATGYRLVDYPHIRPLRIYGPAVLTFQAIDVRVPAGLTIAYVPGVSDNVAPVLRDLGLDVTVIEPAALAAADLSRFRTVVVGPRAYEAYPEVLAQRERLLDFARAGGTLVVQYQQNEVQRPGVVPYPMTVARPHDRVTIEEAPVTVVDPTAAVLTGPNPIGRADFEGWVQERSLYMPRTFDARYQAPLEMHDPGERPNEGAILVAPLGAGTYVYTSLSLFRQLPAGVPGAARLLVNLLAAGQRPVVP